MTDITVSAALNVDPFRWCRNGGTTIRRDVTVSALSITTWDVYDASLRRLQSGGLGPCITVDGGASLTLRGAFDMYSDVPVVSAIDLQEYLALFAVNPGGALHLISTSITMGPGSDLTALQSDLQRYGINSARNIKQLVVESWKGNWTSSTNNATFAVELRSVYFNINAAVVVTSGEDLQQTLQSQNNRFLSIDADISLGTWQQTLFVSWPVSLTTAQPRIVDTSFKQSIITTLHGGAIRLKGDFTFTNCVVQSSRFYEEGLLLFVFLSTGATITDPHQVDGAMTIQGATVYGQHQSPLWSPELGSLYPLCVGDFLLNHTRPTPNDIQVRQAYFQAEDFYMCTANTSVTSESYRLLQNVTLRIGTYVRKGKRSQLLIILLPVLAGIVLLAAAVAGIIWLVNKRRDNKRVLLGLGANVQNTAKEVLGDVHLEETIGWGSYGRVYRAIWEGREVAVKVGYPVRVTEDQDPLQEAKITENLHHNNIVQTLRYTQRLVSRDSDQKHEEVVHIEPWYVMQYCDRGTLQMAIQANTFGHSHKYKLVWALRCLLDISNALAYLHGMGVMHGDLTCSNAMLVSDEQDPRGFHVKVADFGQAQVFSKWPGPQKNVQSYGTVTHQPPEVLMNGVLTPSADVWAFGMIMWELFTGTAPYSEYRPAQMIYIITVAKHLPALPTHCPQDYQDLMLSCWQRQKQRPDFAQVQLSVSAMLRKLSTNKT